MIIGTLGGVGGWLVFDGPITLGGVGAVAVWKMVSKWCSAARHASPSFENGAAGAGLHRA